MNQDQRNSHDASLRQPPRGPIGETDAPSNGKSDAMGAWGEFLRDSGAPVSPAVDASPQASAGSRGGQASQGAQREARRKARPANGRPRRERSGGGQSEQSRTGKPHADGSAQARSSRGVNSSRRPSVKDSRNTAGRGAGERSSTDRVAAGRGAANRAADKRGAAGRDAARKGARPTMRSTSSPEAPSASAAGNTASSALAHAGELARKFASNKRMVLIAAIAVVLIVVIAWYAGGAGKYHQSYYPNTEAFGVPIGELTPTEVQALADEKLADYTLHLTGSSLDVQIPGKEIGLRFKSNQSAQDILENQNTLFWPLMALLPHDVSDLFDTEYNENSLLGAIQLATASSNGAALSAASSEVHFDEQAGQWVYTPVEAGTTIDVQQLVAALDAPIRELQTEFTVPSQCVSRIEVKGTASQKQAAAQKANELCSQYNLVFMLGESTPLTIDASVAAGWISFNDDFEVSIDEAKKNAWLADLRMLLSGTDQRTYTRPDGKICTVTGGTYGWQALDVDDAMATIESGLETGISGQSIPCAWEGNGFLGLPGADWGKRYIDVDMDEQYARFYDANGDIIWESDVITGVWGTDFETPTGVYTITEKRSPAQLRSVGQYVYVDENGETQVEEDHVFGRDVEYWMPFIRTFIGFHDAWWQTSFGGQLYKDAALGSGGCVNLPPEKAAELYSIILPGDVVVTHN